MARGEGLAIRASVHVGEVELVGNDVRGLAVHEASRILSEAGPNEILVSETTRALAQPAGLGFEPRGNKRAEGSARAMVAVLVRRGLTARARRVPLSCRPPTTTSAGCRDEFRVGVESQEPWKTTNLGEADGLPTIEWSQVETQLADLLTHDDPRSPNRSTFWLTTLNADGSPHVTSVGALWHAGSCWFQTGERTRKAKNVARDRAARSVSPRKAST